VPATAFGPVLLRNRLRERISGNITGKRRLVLLSDSPFAVDHLAQACPKANATDADCARRAWNAALPDSTPAPMTT
jgi:hypothetical protein